MWRAFDDTGRLQFADFVETTTRLIPMYWVRVLGGALYLVGALLCGWNMWMTWRTRPKTYEEPVVQAPALPRATPVASAAGSGWARFVNLGWHRRWEAMPLLFTVMTTLAVVVASLFEIIPTFLIRSNVPTIASVRPYTPLELAGRDLYIREGCFNCHSQMIRPFRHETERYGEYSKPGEFVYDHPFLWGSRRIGPDLARQGGKYPDLWHVRHMERPTAINANSIMPPYPHLLTARLDPSAFAPRVAAMKTLGVPYTDADVAGADASARAQAEAIGASIASQGGPGDLADREIVALIAYLQRLGKDARGEAAAMAGAPAGRK
jgi:cytochrome c oxidase cbb3-type subunit I/II